MALTYLNSKMIEEPASFDQIYVTSLTALSTTIQNTLTNDLTAINVTGDSVIDVDTPGNALRITQRGIGNALVVEDSANPDSTPFVVNNIGRVGIGTTAPTAELDVNGIIKGTNITVTSTGTIPAVVSSNVTTQNLTFPTNGTGGIINNATLYGNLTIFGTISALSGIAVTSTFTSQSSALSVVNTGPEIALYVNQSPNLSGVAVFVGSGTEVLKVNNPNPNPFDLPAVVVTGVLSAGAGTSTNWNTAFNRSTVFSSVSGRYNSTSTVVETNSANWNATYTNVQSNSASWNYGSNVGTVYAANSASYPKRFATSIGNGSLTAFEVTHSLGTRDVITQVYDNTTYEVVLPSISNLTTNTVGLSFDTAPSSNAFRVVVIG